MEMTPTEEIKYLKHVIELMQEQLHARDNMITSLLQMQHPVMTSQDELKSVVKGAISEWADSINIGQSTEQIDTQATGSQIQPGSVVSSSECYRILMNLNIPIGIENAIPMLHIRREIQNLVEAIPARIPNDVIDNSVKRMVKRGLLIQVPISAETKKANDYPNRTKFLYCRK